MTIKVSSRKLCECGCGNFVITEKARFLRGHNMYVASNIKEYSDKMKGRIFTEEHKKKLSDAAKGNKNGLGVVFTKERREKISKANKGRKHSKETIIKFSGPNNHGWKGGKYKSAGRTFIYNPNHPNNNGKYILQSHLIVEKSLGRYLNIDKEIVHHINGIKSDDRLENLQVLSSTKYAHIHKFWEKRKNVISNSIEKI